MGKSRRVGVTVVTIAAIGLLAGVLLRDAPYRSNAEFHAAIEVVGSLVGILAGYALLARFLALGQRIDLVLSLAFGLNAVEDLAHGLLPLLALRGVAGAESVDLQRFMPATFAAGRLVLATTLVAAGLLGGRLGHTDRARREATVAASLAATVLLGVTLLVFYWRTPTASFPEAFISRPADLVSAALLLTAFVLLIRQRDVVPGGFSIAVAAGIGAVGQVTIAFSVGLYDAPFDFGHLAKILGYAVVVFGFVTSQVTLIARERHVLDSLLATERTRAAFVSTVSHELRTPLTAVEGFAQLLRTNADATEEMRKDWLERIARNAARLRRMVEDILTFSRLDGEPSRRDTSTVDLRELISRLVADLEPLLGSHRVHVGTSSAEVVTNATALEQIVANLLTNAAKFTPEGTSITVDWELGADGAHLWVADEGPGIPPQERDRIFEPFARGERAYRETIQGAGIGLTVTDTLCTSIGAELQLEHTSTGATFSVRLPTTALATDD